MTNTDIDLSDLADATNDAVESALAIAGQVADAASDRASEVVENVAPQIEALAEHTRQRPLLIFGLGVAVGAGVVLALTARRRKNSDHDA